MNPPSFPSVSKRKLITALLLAAAFSPISSSDGWLRIWRAVKLMVCGLYDGKSVDERIYRRRMECCRACPLFYHKLETCSSPISTHGDLGCWCYMPAKAMLPEAKCWIDESCEGLKSFGWSNYGR